MHMIHHLLIGTALDAQAILVSDDPSNERDGITVRGLDTIKLVTLWSLVEAGSPDDRFDERMDSVKVLSAGDDGPWVDILPDRLVTALAEIAEIDENEVECLEASWSQTEEFDGWDMSEIDGLTRLIGDLAQTAKLEGKTLIVYAGR